MGFRIHTGRASGITTMAARCSDLPDDYEQANARPGQHAVIFVDLDNREEFVMLGSPGELAEVLRLASGQIERAAAEQAEQSSGQARQEVNR